MPINFDSSVAVVRSVGTFGQTRKVILISKIILFILTMHCKQGKEMLPRQVASPCAGVPEHRAPNPKRQRPHLFPVLAAERQFKKGRVR